MIAASPDFPGSRAAGLDRLARFLPKAGRDYAAGRNTDPGPGRPSAVSRLSPYLRHRLVSEDEVVSQVVARHGLGAADKFMQEVLWRTYWKGWLELRPGVWSRYRDTRQRQREGLVDETALADAETGRTGIEGFDDWARELVATGFLHNHARMWFASIWLFTLRLPWALGADFFLRHLVDADAASNTLSWRWVAGLQTAGKTYLATADNIARHTEGRFAPRGLARHAVALIEPPIEPPRNLPKAESALDGPALLLVTHEDFHPEGVMPSAAIRAAVVVADAGLLWGSHARRFVADAAGDTIARARSHYGCETTLIDALDAQPIIEVARAAGVRQVVTAYAPVGPVADALAAVAPRLAAEGITLVSVRRNWDTRFWPHATKGFFAFKERIPGELGRLGLA